MCRMCCEFLGGWRAVGLFVLRIVVGAAFMLHGWPKIHNATGWMGDAYPGWAQAVAAFSEFGGGALLILGLLTPLAAVAIGSTMAVAVNFHYSKGDPFVGKGGPSYELAAVYLAMMIMFLLVGPGRLSVDALIWGRRPPAEPPKPKAA